MSGLCAAVVWAVFMVGVGLLQGVGVVGGGCTGVGAGEGERRVQLCHHCALQVGNPISGALRRSMVEADARIIAVFVAATERGIEFNGTILSFETCLDTEDFLLSKVRCKGKG